MDYDIITNGFFDFEHLPEDLQKVSMPFSALAHSLAVELPACAETSVALRKLLEAKDAAVRSALLLRKTKVN